MNQAPQTVTPYHTILLIEDDIRLSALVVEYLEKNGMHVETEFRGDKAVERILSLQPDLVVLDIMLPGLDGFEVCKQVRPQYHKPILMLTALGTTEDIVLGLETGADDYLTKPFKFKELLARLGALNRRNKVVTKPIEILEAQGVTLNLATKEVSKNNEPIKLTAKEFKLLEYLLKNKNRVVTRTDILEDVWEVDFDLGTNVIDVYINYLRKKAGKGLDTKLIETVIGMGYIIKT